MEVTAKFNLNNIEGKVQNSRKQLFCSSQSVGTVPKCYMKNVRSHYRFLLQNTSRLDLPLKAKQFYRSIVYKNLHEESIMIEETSLYTDDSQKLYGIV